MFPDLAFGVDTRDGKQAGAVKIEVWIEVLAVKIIELRRPVAGDVIEAEMLADDTGVLGLGERIVIAVPGA